MGLVLVKNIQRITDFKEVDNLTSHIVVELKLLNCKKLEEKAKQIDKENYSKDCFCIEYNYVHKEKRLYLLDCGMYYIDINGEKHYLDCGRFNLANIKNSVLMEFNKFLKDKETYLKNHNTDYDKI